MGAVIAVRDKADRHRDDIVMLALLSVVVGAATGIIVAVFRLTLAAVSGWRDEEITQAHHWHIAGFLLVVTGCTAAVTVAAWLVRRFSTYASGSGVPEVGAALTGDLPPVPLRRILFIKFVGDSYPSGVAWRWGRKGRACKWAQWERV